MESVVKNIDALLVVDETYYEFSWVTFVDMVSIAINSLIAIFYL